MAGRRTDGRRNEKIHLERDRKDGTCGIAGARRTTSAEIEEAGGERAEGLAEHLREDFPQVAAGGRGAPEKSSTANEAGRKDEVTECDRGNSAGVPKSGRPEQDENELTRRKGRL